MSSCVFAFARVEEKEKFASYLMMMCSLNDSIKKALTLIRFLQQIFMHACILFDVLQLAVEYVMRMR